MTLTADDAIAEVVAANRILAQHGVLDAFGHVSARHPDRPGCFILARSVSPELVTRDDLLVFNAAGEPEAAAGRTVYAERFIHAAVYAARPDVGAVVHSHAVAVVPFSVTRTPLRPIAHVAASIGPEPPVWDSADDFGDTDLLVRDIAMGRSLAAALGSGSVALMRGHGSVIAQPSLRATVLTAIYLQVNAELLWRALTLGEPRHLSRGEIEKATALSLNGMALDRAWHYWLSKVSL